MTKQPREHDKFSSNNEATPPTRLWVERGFSRREIVPRMQAAVPNLEIISTEEQPIGETPTIDYPDLSTPEGIDKMNQLIEEHEISAIWPQNSARFDLDGINAEVHVAATPEVISLVDDKARFSEWLGEEDVFRADATEVVGAAGVLEEYARRRAEGQEVCVKPVIGVNGEGYWHLTESDSAVFLNKPERHKIHPEVYARAMEMRERDAGPERLVVMEWLPGPEASLDLLCVDGMTLAHAARTKMSHNTQRIQSEHIAIPHAREVAKKLGLCGIVSMQYRLDAEGEWKMLEVNPRPAGGSINSEDAGFGIITGWAKLVGEQADPSDITQHEDDVWLTVERNVRIG